jgi:hypothetical protein
MYAHMNVKTLRTAWFIQTVSIEDVAKVITLIYSCKLSQEISTLLLLETSILSFGFK